MGSTARGGNDYGVVSSPLSSDGEYKELYDEATEDSFWSDEHPVRDWFKANSNIEDWTLNQLTTGEQKAIQKFTGSAFSDINRWQYTIPWESMNDEQRAIISKMYNGLNKFELNSGVVVDRACDFQIFGKKKGEKMSMSDIYNHLKGSNGVVQNDGFMSFTTNKGGFGVAGSGLVIRLRVPPSVGAGGYVDHFSSHEGEKEFILNNNSVLRFDLNSMYTDNAGRVHIDADWLGRAKSQTISPTNKSAMRKK